MVLIEKLLTIPDECKVNDIIAKDVIFSEGGLKSSDKKIFTNYVKHNEGNTLSNGACF